MRRLHDYPVDINVLGIYRAGLTPVEINLYLELRTGLKSVKALRKKFDQVAGVNTMAIGPKGQPLMYRHDVKRFADVIISGRPTYFD